MHINFSEKIDKNKLLKIAHTNALLLVEQGVLPVGSVKKHISKNLPIKTIDELTGNILYYFKYFL